MGGLGVRAYGMGVGRNSKPPPPANNARSIAHSPARSPPLVGRGRLFAPTAGFPLALDTARWYIPPNFNHRSATEDSVMNTVKPAVFVAPPPRDSGNN